MNVIQIVFSIIIFLLSAGAFVIAYRQYKEKGFLFNNAYIYASGYDRSKMNKTPYYKQSAVVFLGMGIMFFLAALDIILNRSWLFFGIIGVAIALAIYAILSSIYIGRKNNQTK